MFSGVSAENIKENRLCVFCASSEAGGEEMHWHCPNEKIPITKSLLGPTVVNRAFAWRGPVSFRQVELKALVVSDQFLF